MLPNIRTMEVDSFYPHGHLAQGVPGLFSDRFDIQKTFFVRFENTWTYHEAYNVFLKLLTKLPKWNILTLSWSLFQNDKQVNVTGEEEFKRGGRGKQLWDTLHGAKGYYVLQVNYKPFIVFICLFTWSFSITCILQSCPLYVKCISLT